MLKFFTFFISFFIVTESFAQNYNDNYSNAQDTTSAAPSQTAPDTNNNVQNNNTVTPQVTTQPDPPVATQTAPEPAPKKKVVKKKIIKKEEPSTSQEKSSSSEKKNNKDDSSASEKQNDKKEKSAKPEEKDILNEYLQKGKINTAEQPNNPSMPSAWGPFFFLLFVAGACYYSVKFLRKRLYQNKIDNTSIDFIRTVGSVPLNPQASLSIVEIGDKYYILGITSSSVQLLTRVDDLNLILKIKSLPLETNDPKNFKEIFSSLFQSKESKKLDPNISKNQFQDFVQKQKSRLDKLK